MEYGLPKCKLVRCLTICASQNASNVMKRIEKLLYRRSYVREFKVQESSDC